MNKVISIEGMMCEHCQKKVHDALSEVAKDVEISLTNKKAIIKDTNASNELLTKIIDDLGFEVVGIENE